MAVWEIIGVTLMILSVVVLVCVMIRYINHDNNTLHLEMVIRTFTKQEIEHHVINDYLLTGWKVKYQSQPIISADGLKYIEYVIYKDESTKKGDRQ